MGQDDQNTSPQSFEGLAGYTYNPNSQILTSSLKSGMPVTNYSYTPRNWVNLIQASDSRDIFFREGLGYNPNGNIYSQFLDGTYKDNFSSSDLLAYHYTYDKSNRLLQADATIGEETENNFDLSNTYDHDGNITKLIRYEDGKNPTDVFNYSYQSGTNKLLKVRGQSTNDYSYDANGNLLYDNVNDVWDMKYDFRNLLLECTSKNPDIQNPANGDAIYYTKYNYDEAGNRISKLIWKYNSDDPHPTFPAGSWPYEKTEFYIRNISGAEVATYNAAQYVQFWNIWGTDNVGRIKGNGEKEFYIKDHLGSVRCVIDSKNDIISAQDLDAWGHKMNGRKYSVDATSSKYKFTSKERDIETDYDYFGARYYDSRIGRWGGVDQNYDKYLNLSPYNYASLKPLIIKDVDGKDIIPIFFPDYKPESKGSKFPAGHSGILIVDNQSGDVNYYEYGAYDEGIGNGIVRRSGRENEGKTFSKIEFDDNNEPTEGSVNKVLEEVGGGRIEGAYIKTTKKETENVKNFLENSIQVSNSKSKNFNSDRKKYNPLTNNCSTFVCEAAEKAGVFIFPSYIDTPQGVSIYFRLFNKNVDYDPNK